jgi:hypothetical protein
MTLKEEDIVDAFLYVDKKKRFAWQIRYKRLLFTLWQ